MHDAGKNGLALLFGHGGGGGARRLLFEVVYALPIGILFGEHGLAALIEAVVGCLEAAFLHNDHGKQHHEQQRTGDEGE